MHVMNQLPQFPTDGRASHAPSLQSFVDEEVVSKLIAGVKKPWQERRYFGEDFAGKIEFVAAVSQPIAEDAFVDAVAEPFVSLSPASVTPWRRVLAVASAAAVLTLASFLGLWAAHAMSPEQASKPAAKSQHSDLASLPHQAR